MIMLSSISSTNINIIQALATKIKQNFVIMNSFSFKTVTLKEVHEIILKLDDSKATGGEIPLKLIKDNEILCIIM